MSKHDWIYLVWLCLLWYKHISHSIYAAWYQSLWFLLKALLAAAVAKKCIKRGGGILNVLWGQNLGHGKQGSLYPGTE